MPIEKSHTYVFSKGHVAIFNNATRQVIPRAGRTERIK